MTMVGNTSKFLTLLSCLLLLGCAQIIGYAQIQSKENRDWERQQRDRQREERESENRARALRELGDARRTSAPRAAPHYPSADPTKLTDEQKAILAPSAEDEAAFPSFLGQPNRGLVRLLPREKYDQTIQMPLKGGGAFYSFAKLSHEASPWSDIKLQDGKVYSGVNDLTLGLMTELPDVSLENVSLENPTVKFVMQLPLAAKYPEHKGQVDKYRSGFEADGKIYKSALPALLDHTYILRSTIYDRVDSVIALRVIRIDSDGSVTLLWKLLNRVKVKKLKDIP
jgi:hypothetical protein